MRGAIGFRLMHRALLVSSALLAAGSLCAQEAVPTKEFEVVSIRPDQEMAPEVYASNPRAHLPQITAGFVRLPYENMAAILRRAFGVSTREMIAPEWTERERFSIEAKIPDGATSDDLPEMFRSMLSKRFHMVYHKEARTTFVLLLTVAKGGIKAKKAEPAQIGSRPRRRPLGPLGWHLDLTLTSAGLTEYLKGNTFSPVIDRTGLNGAYVFSFDFYPFGPLGEDGKPLEPVSGGDFYAYLARHYSEALSPLGLRLTPSRLPMENVIIDHLDRTPTEN